MGMFLCAKCDNFAYSDDGCYEAPIEKYGKFKLICADCMEDLNIVEEE